MDFFEHQDKARRSTRLLVVLFLLAIIGIVIAVNLAFYAFVFFSPSFERQSLIAWLQSPNCLYVSLATLGVILAGSIWRFISLLDGGTGIIRMTGAEAVHYDENDPQIRQLLNVVEEMAIASGTPVPGVYVMRNEQGINAFVAGHDTDDAILVVTQGLMESLDRDEMQGVIGHEFSHLLNGDVRINLRLMALLGGILLIGQLGEVMLHGGSHRRHYGSRSGNSAAAQAIIGLVLLAIGYIGLFFGRMIKAAISRQREFLADASAVQFTRNKAGISEALLKVKHSSSPYLVSDKAEELSHMCFSPALHFQFFGKMFATHPPIDERIRAIDPSFIARDRARQRVADKASQPSASATETPQTAIGFAASTSAPLESASAATLTSIHSGEQLLATVGAPKQKHLEYAHTIYSLIPNELKAFFHHPDQATLVIYALILSFSQQQSRQSGLEKITLWHDDIAARFVQKRIAELESLGSRLRIPVVDLCLTSLKQLDQQQRQDFLLRAEQLVIVDQRYTLFEFTLLALLRNQLRDKKSHRDSSQKVELIRYHRLLSLCAHATGGSKENRQQAFDGACQVMHFKSLELLPPSSVSATQLAEDLHELSKLAPLRKKSLLTVISDMFLADKILQVAEAELIRGICESLHVPMPPLLDPPATA